MREALSHPNRGREILPRRCSRNDSPGVSPRLRAEEARRAAASLVTAVIFLAPLLAALALFRMAAATGG